MKQTPTATALLLLLVLQTANGSKIVLHSRKANRFLGTTKRGVAETIHEYFTESLTDENVRERCYTPANVPKECTREQVFEKYENNQQTDLYYQKYKCEKYPGIVPCPGEGGNVPYTLS